MLVVFTGCSSGVVCVTSYRQCAQSEILEARNNEVVNKVILFNRIIYYKRRELPTLGNYAASRVNFIPTFRNK